MHPLSRPSRSDRTTNTTIHQSETLFDRVARAKARWLRRVMYESPASAAQKCFAYIVVEHLNCVTLDAWPNQERLAQLLGSKAIKTVQRAARGLEAIGELHVGTDRKGRRRYAPIFRVSDYAKNVAENSQICPENTDRNDRESFLVIHPTKSFPTTTAGTVQAHPGLSPQRRGEIEVKVAELIGADGWQILGRLGEHDDAIVQRLCNAFEKSSLGLREITAARLAARQL